MKRLIDAREGRPWIDPVSYGRRSPGARGRLGPAAYEAIARTTARAPEVMVKVTGGGRSVGKVRDSIDYFHRQGELEIETDDGFRLRGKGVEKELVKDWELQLESWRARTPYSGKPGRRSPRLVHNLMFSMPAGTPPQKVLAAVRKFGTEKFAGNHRYAMVLHTDQKHPHVHMWVKVMGDNGRKLRIDKATLRAWRHDFAKYLRELGVAANATDRVTRGVTKPQKLDGIYRANMRKDSHHMIGRAERVGSELLKGDLKIEPAKSQMMKTREALRSGWLAIGEQLKSEGRFALADQVKAFLRNLPEVRTEKEGIAAAILERARQASIGESLNQVKEREVRPSR